MTFYKEYVEETFDQNRVLTDFKIKVPENFNFAYDVMDRFAAENPSGEALAWCNVEGEERFFTYADIKTLSDKTANFLQSQGITRGSKVMLILKRHYEWWYTVLALHKLGAVCIPATNLLTKKDLVYRFQTGEISAVIASGTCDITKYIDEAAPECPTLKTKIIVRGSREGWLNFTDEVEKASSDFIRPTGELASQNTDLMLLYFTSGTSGMPKMVARDYTYPLGHILTAKHWHNVVDGGRHITVAETGWAKAVWGKIYGQWFCGTALFVYDFDKFVANDVLSMVSKYKVTTFCAPPTIYRFFIQEDLSKYDLSSLTYACTAGEALNAEVFERFKEYTGLRLMEAFGQSESTVLIGTLVGMESKPGSLGKPSPQYDIDLVDDDGNSVDVGATGEIVLRTDGNTIGIFKGYYKDDEKTNSVWYDGLYHTGDLAWKDEDGYYWYVSRKDDLIKSSGYRISPFEVESVLMEHPSVVECAITGAPDPVRGQVIKATIVLARDYVPSEELKKELQTYVKVNTAPYKYPRIVEFVNELPKTISGKIKRTDIRGNKQ